MHNYYKIKSILHSGKLGERGTTRTDNYNLLRVNRIIKFNDSVHYGSIQVGFPMTAQYVKDANGRTIPWGFCTSTVVDWDYIYENTIRVETLNTIYEFERVEGK